MAQSQNRDEKGRVDALKEYNILDTLPEADYDDITKLASGICETNVGAITLIDDKIQWFKSLIGVEQQIRSVPKDSSICVSLLDIESHDVLVIPDCSKDDRFADNPIVNQGPRIKFYAGAPLITPEGYIIGSLCVLDKEVKQLSAFQIKALKILAKQTVKLLELRKTSAKLSDKQVDLEARFKELEQFSYAVSHDLRGPVKNISALIGLLNIQLKSGNISDSELFMTKIVKESDRMNRLVADLLEYSLVGKNNQKKEWIKISEVLEDVKLSMEQKLKENKAIISFIPGTDKIFAVRTDITRLIQNLLENAIKFKRTDLDPVIKVSCKEEGDFWKLSVEDNGIGIDKNSLEKVFELFNRLHTNEQYQGTGIGLAVCKRIAENHDGRIWVESTENSGSTFHVLLKK